MRVDNFTGGLDTRLRSHLIADQEAVVYENIDNFVGPLTPAKDKTDTAIAISAFPFFYIDKAMWVSGPDERHYTEYNKILYYSDVINGAKKFNGVDTFNLGTATPTVKAVTTISDSAPSTPTGFNVTLAAGTLPKNSLMRYKIVNVSATGLFSLSLTKSVKTQVAADTQITIKEIADFDNKLEVYRSFKGIFYKVGDILTDTGTLVDNVLDISANQQAPSTFQQQPIGIYQYTYTFYNSADGTESGSAPLSSEIDVSQGGEVLLSSLEVSIDPQVDQRRIYRIGGGTSAANSILTSFTLVDVIDNIVTSYVDSIGDTQVIGDILDTINVGPAPTGLRFLTENNAIFFGAVGRRLYFTNIDEPNKWPALNFIDFERDITGIGATPNGMLVFDKFKTWIISGTDSSVFTRFVLSRDQGCISHDTIASVSDILFWASTDGICASNGGKIQVVSKPKLNKVTFNPVNSVVHDEVYYLHENDGTITAMDMRVGGVFKKFSLGTTRLVVAEDILYGISTGTLHSLFSSNDNLPIRFKSKNFTEGTLSLVKIYKSIYVRSEGQLNIKIYVDGTLAQEVSLSGAQVTNEIKINHNNQRGYGLEIEVQGTGTVYEIENKVFPRSNGK